MINKSDYNENTALDRYDVGSVDGEEYGMMEAETRQLVEAKLRRRDREQARLHGFLPAAFLDEGMVSCMKFIIRGRRRCFN